jgi:Domain of unknown function (DUF4342)
MTATMNETPAATETQRVSGERLLSRIKELIHEGNVRRIIIKNDEGHTFLEIPLTVGVVGALLLPVWVAVGAVAALANDYTLDVERTSAAT